MVITELWTIDFSCFALLDHYNPDDLHNVILQNLFFKVDVLPHRQAFSIFIFKINTNV